MIDYNYFKRHYKMIAIDLSKQLALDADPEAIKQISFTEILSDNNNRWMFFITEEVKETILDFSQGTVKLLRMCSTILFCSNIIYTDSI